MSYRNDYDAAQARVAALEAEHAKLVAENARLRGPSTVATPAFARGSSATPLVLVAAITLGFIVLALAGAS